MPISAVWSAFVEWHVTSIALPQHERPALSTPVSMPPSFPTGTIERLPLPGPDLSDDLTARPRQFRWRSQLYPPYS